MGVRGKVGGAGQEVGRISAGMDRAGVSEEVTGEERSK